MPKQTFTFILVVINSEHSPAEFWQENLPEKFTTCAIEALDSTVFSVSNIQNSIEMIESQAVWNVECPRERQTTNC